jgi:hypothetical protein
MDVRAEDDSTHIEYGENMVQLQFRKLRSTMWYNER